MTPAEEKDVKQVPEKAEVDKDDQPDGEVYPESKEEPQPDVMALPETKEEPEPASIP